MTFEEIVNYRRSVRIYQKIEIDPKEVKHCLEMAALAPNSSNMQLWCFYHITDKDLLHKLAYACFSQSAATTATQMVVFVTRQDLFWQHSQQMKAIEIENVLKNSPKEKQFKRIKRWELYYGKVIPFLYARFFGLLGLLRKIIVITAGIFRRSFYQVSENDQRVVVHKTCALAAQTFMLGMASKGYDTCPMEGFDSGLVRKTLNLPYGAEVNMIVACGIRDEEGVRGERSRLPFEEVYVRL
jgi:nitroreductase